MIYKYFPFGGYLTKDIVYKRIKDLLEEIHKEEENKDKIGIHLDLYETEQQGIMNDFLFSFLFTKYYKNDENVIYIPKDYKIYVEIPNCFINFMDTYPILNIFQNEQRKEINLENQRELELRQNEELLFNNLINIDVEHFITGNIGIDNPSYYQKRQFINSLLSQITEDNIRKLKTDNTIFNKIIESTKHFTENHYSKLLKGEKEENKGENKDDKNEDINNENISNSIDDKILEKLSSIDDQSLIENLKKKDENIPLIFYNCEKKILLK